MAKWLSGIWLLCALLANIHVIILFGGELPVFGLIGVIIALAIPVTALLYGINYRCLHTTKRFLWSLNLFPALCPNLYILGLLATTIRFLCKDADPATIMFFIMVFLPLGMVPVLTVVAWKKCQYEGYLWALALTGLETTVLNIALSGYLLLDVRIGVLLFPVFVYVGLPGLWAAMACFAATVLFPPTPDKQHRNSNVALLCSLYNTQPETPAKERSARVYD